MGSEWKKEMVLLFAENLHESSDTCEGLSLQSEAKPTVSCADRQASSIVAFVVYQNDMNLSNFANFKSNLEKAL